MDYKRIEQLLERYWQCLTSLDEEKQLRDFFNQEEVPAHLAQFKELFIYEELQQQETLGVEFDEKMLKLIEAPVVKAKRITFMSRIAPLFKAAAAVALVVLIGNVVHRTILEDEMNGYDYENYVDTYDNPEAAYQQVSSALMMISESINKSKKLQSMDSLQLERPQDIIE